MERIEKNNRIFAEKTATDKITKMYEELEYASSIEGKKKTKRHIALKIIGDIIYLIVLAFFIFSFVAINTAKEKGITPQVFGLSLCYVKTGSMEPTIETGSTIVCIEPNDKSNLEVGEIVTFYNLSGIRITHRIVEIVEIDGVRAYRTKGDNPANQIDGEVLTPDRVISVMAFKLF